MIASRAFAKNERRGAGGGPEGGDCGQRRCRQIQHDTTVLQRYLHERLQKNHRRRLFRTTNRVSVLQKRNFKTIQYSNFYYLPIDGSSCRVFLTSHLLLRNIIIWITKSITNEKSMINNKPHHFFNNNDPSTFQRKSCLIVDYYCVLILRLSNANAHYYHLYTIILSFVTDDDLRFYYYFYLETLTPRIMYSCIRK